MELLSTPHRRGNIRLSSPSGYDLSVIVHRRLARVVVGSNPAIVIACRVITVNQFTKMERRRRGRRRLCRVLGRQQSWKLCRIARRMRCRVNARLKTRIRSGASVGSAVGMSVGCFDGTAVGSSDGFRVGSPVGSDDEVTVGSIVGISVG